MNKVIHTVTKTEIKDQEIVITEQNYEGLWIVTPFEESDFWFLKTGKIYTFNIILTIYITYNITYNIIIYI